MKKRYLFLWLCIFALMQGCTEDHCSTRRTFMTTQPIYMKPEEYRKDYAPEAAQPMQETGKIYLSGSWIFINELYKGIHIVDNRNPRAPRNVGFLPIPGNVDMAARGAVLYADNCTDLLTFDISNPAQVRLISRRENAFPAIATDPVKGVVAGYKEVEVTEVMESGCDGNPGQVNWFVDGIAINRDAVNFSPAFGQSVGGVNKGGSMARFALTDRYLYTISHSEMFLFDLAEPTAPQPSGKVNLNAGDIETIFPYRDKLFLGSSTGMYIYDNSNPASPVRVSTFQHARACDPVVAEGDYAYVTLRTGNRCVGNLNQLDVVNISNPAKPFLVKSYPMQHPHGVGIDNGLLFVCEGDFGLKVFNDTDPNNISGQQLAHFKDVQAYDVIPTGTTLLVIGKKGLYQYDYSNPKDLRLLSVLPVEKK